MKKSIHSESEMVKAVKELEAEADVRRPCIGQPDIEGCD